MNDSGAHPAEHAEALILVVHDDAAVRQLACAALEQAGFSIAEAEDGRQGLEDFERLQPDIILLDVMLPGLDGFSICSAIRQLPVGSDTPILMMTGLDDTEAINEAYEAGATDFITKPISWPVLCHRVRYILRSNRAIQDLRVSESRLSKAHRIARMGVWEWALQRDKLYWSKEVYLIFGINPAGFEVTYQSFIDTIHPSDKESFQRAMDRALSGNRILSVDNRIVLPNGDVRFCHTEGEVFYDAHGRATKIAGTVQDITERKRTEEQIRSLAYFDSITGLPNRLLFHDQLERAIAFAARHRRKVAVMFLDLDRFKEINDTLGHAAGDDLLKGIAGRLQQCLRGYDLVSRNCALEGSRGNSTIARLGGDEFTVILQDIGGVQHVTTVARRILKAVAEPFSLGEVEICISASIGISIYPDDGNDSGALVKNADAAMYHAKKEGRNNLQFFTQAMNDAALERLVLEQQLRKALANEEFTIHYQPQVDAAKGEVVGLEALIRWQSPELGFISPAKFIPFAEEIGQVVAIDEWVVAAVCRQIKTWLNLGITPPRVAVNLSGHHLIRMNLVGVMMRSLAEAGIEGELLELELTEGVFMQKSEEVIATLHSLRELGLTISIDDFGTGYSSLSYLKRFPIDTLKIDRSFVNEVSHDADSATITSTIISMAKSLRLGVIAEGVETEEQREFLQENDCTIMQGYYFSPPVPAEEVIQVITDGLPAPKGGLLLGAGVAAVGVQQ
ncbi:EAL domain-containing protein [Geomonas sp. RF6]|uniref:putative bifunctional diguanylate cyclase/phosphodiesterase n=1 Tax=Geomonas sp. RF6 TaxID=2897342 RepID=UPI001E54517F|nr:EAL domain-containing protein [Geomonas sp. RF6]UFS69291.1 EAL domain-containing protein [Geomonas sp. RF6]